MSGSVPPTDVVTRATAAIEGITPGPWRVAEHHDLLAGSTTYVLEDIERFCEYRNCVSCGEDKALAEFIAAARSLVPELVSEIERLRAGGPWVEHVERMNAMKRERDGDCICDGNPATTDGPQEDCPWHGREYRYWVDGCAHLNAELERLRNQPGCCCGGCVL